MPKPLRLLMLEDHPKDAELILRALRRAGYEAQYECVCKKADYLARLNPDLDLILSDYQMPQFDGLQALRLLREQGLDIPFIIVSGTIGEDLAVAAMRAGAADYLMKDRLSRLGNAVEQALQSKRLRDETQMVSEALIFAEQKYRSIFENVVEGIYQITPDGHYLMANPSLARIYGYDSPAELLANVTDIARQLYVDPEERGRFLRLLEESGLVVGYETQFRRKDGRVIWVTMNARAVRDEQDHLLHYEGTVEDITERKRAEADLLKSNRHLAEALEQLRAAQEQLVQQERLHALGQMAGGIAHDFNNALAPILGFSELLLNHPDKLENRETLVSFLTMMNTCARDATHIVRRLREFYRHRERGDVFLPMQLNALVEQVVTMTKPRWQDQSQAAGITINVLTELGQIPVVYGVETELREVLTNLIFNALDALPAGGTITISTAHEEEHVILRIADTGVGMTEEVLRRCLEPFYSTKGEHGTGLGLAMVYGIIQRHEGAVDIQSQPGSGTTFIIRLPVSAKFSLKPAEAVALASARNTFRVLVVDDDEQAREVVAEYLKSDGHTVEAAANSGQALTLLCDQPFDFAVIDRAMPGVGGDQLALEIKQLAPRMPVIMLTGFGVMMNATGEIPPHVDLVISKPVTIKELREVVAAIMKKKDHHENPHH